MQETLAAPRKEQRIFIQAVFHFGPHRNARFSACSTLSAIVLFCRKPALSHSPGSGNSIHGHRRNRVIDPYVRLIT